MKADRWITAAVVGALGVAGLAVGVALPNTTAYRIGVVLLALGLMGLAWSRARRAAPTGIAGRSAAAAATALALVVPLAVGVAAPRLLQDDGAWHTEQYAPIATSASGQTYLVGPAQVTVVSTDSGRRAWRAALPGDGAGGAVVNTDGAVLMLEGPRPAQLRAKDGSVLWRHAPALVGRGWFLVAFDESSTTVVSDCGVRHTRCHLVAVDTTGDVAWRRSVHTTPKAADRMRRMSKNAQRDGSAPTTVAVVEKVATSAKAPAGLRIRMVDTTTGRTQGVAAVPSGARLGFDSPYPTRHGVLVSFDQTKQCEWAMYDAGRKLWDLKGSTYCSDSGYSGLVSAAPESTRIYVHDVIGNSWFTIDLRSGHARRLHPGEGVDASGPATQVSTALLGAETILSVHGHTVEATAADSGEHLWTYRAPASVQDVGLGHGVVAVTTTYRGHNPVLAKDADGHGPAAVSVRLLDAHAGSVTGTADLRHSNYWVHALPTGAVLSRSTPATDHRTPLDADDAVYVASS